MAPVALRRRLFYGSFSLSRPSPSKVKPAHRRTRAAVRRQSIRDNKGGVLRPDSHPEQPCDFGADRSKGQYPGLEM